MTSPNAAVNAQAEITAAGLKVQSSDDDISGLRQHQITTGNYRRSTLDSALPQRDLTKPIRYDL